MDTIIPKVIETEIESDRFLVVVEGLLAKRQSRTPEETALFMLLVKLVEDYEREHYSIDDGIQVAPVDRFECADGSGDREWG